jgi:type II secretory pathway component PulF
MAIHILPILRTLAPLIADAGRIAVGLRTSDATAKSEDRMLKLEQQTIRGGEVLKGVAEQLQALAEELRVQGEVTEALRQKMKTQMIISISALVVSVGALLFAILR